MSDTEIRRVALTDAIARLEHAIATRPFHTAYGVAKQDGLRDAVCELKHMLLDDRAKASACRSGILCNARVIVGDSEGEERCGNWWPCAVHGGR